MSDVKCEKKGIKIPTYIPKKAHELPMFFENKPYQGASGRVYPIPYCDGISDEKTDVEYETYTLENEYVKTQVVPALGGKILRGFDKVGNYDFIYYNEVVKPALFRHPYCFCSGTGAVLFSPNFFLQSAALPSRIPCMPGILARNCKKGAKHSCYLL